MVPPSSAANSRLIGRRIWWPSRLSRPTEELPDGQQSLAGNKEPVLQR